MIYVCVDAINKKMQKKANFPAMPSAITKTLAKVGKFAECPVLPSAMAIALGKVTHKTSTKPFNTLYNCGQVQNKDGSDWLVYDDRNTAQHYK